MHELTIQFAKRDLYGWDKHRFWDCAHESLVDLNLSLRLRDGGAGYTPTFAVAPAALAASWYQSIETMAAAGGVSALVLVQEWIADVVSPSLQGVLTALHSIYPFDSTCFSPESKSRLRLTSTKLTKMRWWNRRIVIFIGSNSSLKGFKPVGRTP